MKTELRKLTVDDDKAIYQLCQLLPKEENGYHNDAHGLTYEEYKAWLIKMDEYTQGIHLPNWRVPSSEYWFYVDGIPIGNIRLRHYLNDALKNNGVISVMELPHVIVKKAMQNLC